MKFTTILNSLYKEFLNIMSYPALAATLQTCSALFQLQACKCCHVLLLAHILYITLTFYTKVLANPQRINNLIKVKRWHLQISYFIVDQRSALGYHKCKKVSILPFCMNLQQDEELPILIPTHEMIRYPSRWFCDH